MEPNILLTILLIVVTVIGTVMIPTLILVGRLTSKISQLETNQHADHSTVVGLATVMEKQGQDLNDRKTDIALIQQDIGYIKESISLMTQKIDHFIDRIDEEITIHHSCPNYIEAKRGLKK